MKKRKLLFAAALLCSVGMWADDYTDYLNARKGYEEVTNTSELASPDYYYVLASAENSSCIVNITDKSDDLPSWYSGTAKILCYKTLSSNPISDATNFFIIENNSGYEMFNVGYNPTTKFQTHDGKAFLWVNTGETTSNDYTKFIPVYDATNAYWTLQNNKYPDAEHSDGRYYGFLGPWTAGYINDGEHIAGNRTNTESDLAGHFKIYRISRTRYNKELALLNPNVTSTYLENPSFELSAADTYLTSNITKSNAEELSIFGWTETLGNTDFNNREVINNSTKGTNSNHSTAISAAEGSYHFFMRRSWNNNNSTNFTYTSNTAKYKAGHYVVTYSYILEEGTSSGNTSTGSYMTLQALEGSNVIASNRVNAKNWGTTTPYTNTWATSTLSFDLTEEKTLSLAVVITPRGGNKTEVHLDNFVVTYSPFADGDDYTELATAIETVEGYTLGFDNGEYAPYNLAHALTSAKAIDSFANNPLSVVREAIDALYAITANAGEVDAVYNGNFETVTTGQNYPDGWTRTNGWGKMESGISGDYTTAYYNQPGSLKYGDTGSFTMPLKANTYYTLKVAYRSHESNSTNVTVSVLKGEEGLAAKGLDWTSSPSDWTKQQVVFKTGNEGNYLLTLANYGNTWMTGVSLRRATVEEVKTLLYTELTTANGLYNNGANVGTGVFQIPSSAGVIFNSAINSAQTIYEDASATVENVATAISTLQSAIEAFKSAEINAPDPDKKYYIKVATEGHAKSGNAWLVAAGATSANNPTGYTFSANKAPAAYLAQAWTFTQVSGNSYKISIDIDGTIVYLTNGTANGSAASWKASQIQGTTDSEKAMAFTIEAGDAANTFYIYNTETNSTIACQDGGNIYTEVGNAYFSVEEVSEASVEVSVEAGKLATRIFPFKPTLPEGVAAYSCAANTGTSLTLEVVDDPAANVPYILYSESGCASTNLTGWGSATADTYTEGYLTGVFTRTVVPVDSYVLQTQSGTQAFYKVNDEGAYSSAYRVYVTVPAAGVKSLGFTLDDMETAIEAARAEGESTVTLRYNVAGQQMQNANKGLNIIKMADGSVRKVLVK